MIVTGGKNEKLMIVSQNRAVLLKLHIKKFSTKQWKPKFISQLTYFSKQM